MHTLIRVVRMLKHLACGTKCPDGGEQQQAQQYQKPFACGRNRTAASHASQ